MSANSDDSFLTKLKHKVAYELNEMVDDPNAKQFAEEQKAKEEEQKNQSQQTQQTQQSQQTQKNQKGKDASSASKEALTPQDQSTGTPTETSPPPSKAVRILTKIWNGVTYTFKLLWYPILCLILSTFVANEMIVYPVPTRVLFFMFTFLVCYFLSFMCVFLVFGYMIKGGYQWYIRNKVGDKNTDIMPALFAILPATTSESKSSIVSFLMAPFRYPKSEQKAVVLSDTMSQYWKQLESSFSGLNELKNLPMISAGLQTAHHTLEHMHDPPKEETTNVTAIHQDTMNQTE